MAKALTAQSVEKFKADPLNRREIPDALLTGLYLVVQPSGKKSWAVRYRAFGKPRKVTLGSYPAFELAEARSEAQAVLRRVAKGEDPATAKKIAKRKSLDGEGTVQAIARTFIARHAQRHNRGWRDTARQIGLAPNKALEEPSDDPKTFKVIPESFLALQGHRQIGDITRAEIIAHIDDIYDGGKPIAANRTLAALKRLFSWCVERDLIPSSPCDRVKAPSAEQSRDRILTDAELQAVWKASEGLGWPFGPMVQMLVLTGQRRNEVSGMRWEEIDLKGKLWSLPRERAKNDQPHSVPLSAPAIELLESLPRIEGQDFVFSTTGTTPVSGFSRMKRGLDAKVVAALREEAEERKDDPAQVSVADWWLHDLRRTCASGMARIGINLPVIEKVLNHVSGSFAGIVGVYQRHSFDDEKRAALDAWGNFILTLVDDKPSNVIPISAKVGG
ncbi:site-specific integrase [Mesorhizobium sp.]|uniref:tyrosine-type recombinase/integrase n=1 Tax=Mesorhizobium sp. TaxID=1871066 RepID=UPI000FE48820|nr:site-specific integrase [Mesorhizobium sp.]RWM57446.1 MAG: site-specific integrase [Mesorhizobium sp.]RWM59074.1 MAG: site-specific integrase [Mesorhizobium sp.]RWM99881.1 MAG: site-specific integrase [Mesorhizobium sp.]TIO70362.1 MAG: DUF4102 domain-containing protein [Mesorhizobium sp.]TJV92045.1 MAG: DUF4102 domain-containing protein [Mesorhizobium sp.]